MKPPWVPDVDLDVDGAKRLIEESFPDLAGLPVRRLGSGWDNLAVQVGEDWAFRFPRRRLSEPWIINEVDVLGLLASWLPLPIPRPERVGLPGEKFPFVWSGHRLVPGRTACALDLDDRGRAAWAPSLAAFLRALHQVPTDLVADPPKDEIERANHRLRGPRLLQLVDRLVADGMDLPALRIREVVAQCGEAAPAIGPGCWVHGDLYARHLLVGEDGALCGVIDWGDVHVGDPALDLSIAWSFLPEEARPTFRAHYGGVDEASWCRARQRAVHYGVILLDFATDVGDADLRREAATMLRLAL